MTLAHIAEQWVKRLTSGEIHYDPGRVESRWLPAGDGSAGRFKAILNAGRKARLEPKAA